jgi:hypothetical protein
VSPNSPVRTTRVRRALAATAAGALALGGIALGAAPATAAVDTAGTIANATLTWGLNGESGGGAFFGGCNFLSAGTAGDTGSSRLWTEADQFYRAAAGNVTVMKPDASGAMHLGTWSTKCQTPQGTAVSAASTTSLSKNVVVIEAGSGTAAADGSVRVAWTGSFTVAFYGGLTYWTASDPVLALDANGTGTLTATASGYGASMEDSGKWTTLTPRTITLANITNGAFDDAGLTVTPDYLGKTVTTASTAQSTSGASWGSFPQDFVDFQQETGQSSYWYSSGGSRDAAKPTTPLTVNWTLTPATEEPGTQPADGTTEIGVTVPAATEPATGTFSWAFDTDDAVDLGTATQSGATFTASGALTGLTVTDTRAGGTAPYSWSISGQVSDFSSSAGTFGGSALGWTPKVSGAGAGVTPGAQVSPALAGGTGLGSSATLASSTAAASAKVGADLALVIPGDSKAGRYTATLTVTALS